MLQQSEKLTPSHITGDQKNLAGRFLIDSRNFSNLINNHSIIGNHTDQKLGSKKKDNDPTDPITDQVMTVTETGGTLDYYKSKSQGKSAVSAKYKTEAGEQEIFASKTPKQSRNNIKKFDQTVLEYS